MYAAPTECQGSPDVRLGLGLSGGKNSLLDVRAVHEKDTLWDLARMGWLRGAGSKLDAGLTSAAAQVGCIGCAVARPARHYAPPGQSGMRSETWKTAWLVGRLARSCLRYLMQVRTRLPTFFQLM